MLPLPPPPPVLSVKESTTKPADAQRSKSGAQVKSLRKQPPLAQTTTGRRKPGACRSAGRCTLKVGAWFGNSLITSTDTVVSGGGVRLGPFAASPLPEEPLQPNSTRAPARAL